MNIFQKIIEYYKILRRDYPDSWIIDCRKERDFDRVIEMTAGNSPVRACSQLHYHNYITNYNK